MKRRQRRRKLNNVGMSLVEVVVAIAILSITILPILYTFVQSTRYNAQARMRQQTTAAAQTVMENFKAYSVNEICEQFTNNTFNVSRGSGFATTYTSIPGSNMEFIINGMRYQNVDYDVKVELTAHSSSVSAIESLVYENRTMEHDAVFAGYAGMDADALSKIMEDVATEWTNKEATLSPSPSASPAPSASPSPSASPAPGGSVIHTALEVDSTKIFITERKLKVDISKPGNYVAKVTCEYTYHVTDHPYVTSPGEFSIPDTTYELDLSTYIGNTNQTIFDQATELTGLTLYYYPAYDYGTVSPIQIDTDSIIINNTSGTDVKCYIYKQKNLAVSDTKLSTAENLYDVYISLSGASIYDDNLDTVLGNEAATIPESRIHVNAADGISTRYHGIGYSAAKNGSAALSTETTESLQLMFDVTISVYNSGDLASGGTPLNTLKGTIIE